VIQHPSFRVEPWSLHETALNLEVLAQTESLFALSNGHIGVRGNLDEGEPHGLPGSYLNGFYELRPLLEAESQYGAPESSQTLINVTNASSSACSSMTSLLMCVTATCSPTIGYSISVPEP